MGGFESSSIREAGAALANLGEHPDSGKGAEPGEKQPGSRGPAERAKALLHKSEPVADCQPQSHDFVFGQGATVSYRPA